MSLLSCGGAERKGLPNIEPCEPTKQIETYRGILLIEKAGAAEGRSSCSIESITNIWSGYPVPDPVTMSDHQFNNDAYASDLITYTTFGDTHHSATLSSTEGCDFLDFLGVAQTLKVDFLPLIWQPALDSVGEGGTAIIRQALMNVRMAFAFKHLKRPETMTEEIQTWRVLTAEISILSHPAIRRHPNVVNIEGICWDVAADEGKVWPVLVFEKTEYGDLKRFMTKGAGNQLNIKARLDILFDVAHAVRDLHASGESFDSTRRRRV